MHLLNYKYKLFNELICLYWTIITLKHLLITLDKCFKGTQETTVVEWAIAPVFFQIMGGTMGQTTIRYHFGSVEEYLIDSIP